MAGVGGNVSTGTRFQLGVPLLCDPTKLLVVLVDDRRESEGGGLLRPSA